MNLGLIYLLSPSYINWILEETRCCIGDIEFLKSLKVINKFGNNGHLAHYADIDAEEFKENWSRKVDFEDVKFSGYENFFFSDLALNKNKEKLNLVSGVVKEREITLEEERKIMIFYPGMKINSIETSFIPSEMELSKGGETVLFFLVNNRNEAIDFLPCREKLVVSSFFWSDWQITADNMDKIFDEKRVVEGQVVDGQLIIRV
ncbi:hypothetical protein CQA01_15480 [Cyclobacterium qasimii]|uniref:Uncharacterized protein n=2 Tax=Cyclobacterium qasimii TaxID=1350429 RepID=A0A512C9Y6_9BACT|nr:hypothetical protein CQA01_15480 [Cyclobacterium qasimii]